MCLLSTVSLISDSNGLLQKKTGKRVEFKYDMAINEIRYILSYDNYIRRTPSSVNIQIELL